MLFASYRKHKGLTLEEVATQLGLRSKGHVSDIESGAQSPSLRLALQIEAWSGGEVSAASLLSPEDADLLAHHRRLSAAQPAEAAA